MDTEQKASEIGSGLTSRFRNQLNSFNNYSTSRNRTMQGTADAWRTNLIEQYGKTDSGKLMNEMIQGQITGEAGAIAPSLGKFGLSGAKRYLSGRLARQQAKTAEAREQVDEAFPEGEEGATSGATNPISNQSIAEPTRSTETTEPESTATEDFSGFESGVPGVSESGAIRVSSDYTQGPDPATAPKPTEATPEITEPTVTTTSTDIPTGYTSSSQLGLSEEGMAARNTALQSYSDIYSQAPRQVMFDNTEDPPLSDIMDRMQAGDLTLGDSPAEAVSQEQAGARLSRLLDTSQEQGATDVDFTGGSMEAELASRPGATVIGNRALTSAELQQPQPQAPQPEAPKPTEPVAEDSPFNPSGGVTDEPTTTASIDANTHRTLVQDEPDPSENLKQVKAEDLGDESGDIAGETGAELSGEQTAALGGLEGALGAEEATSGIMAGLGVASSALGILAPLGMLGGLIYEGISAQHQVDEQQKKMNQASAQLSSEISSEDQESQFVNSRPAFGSMALAPNLDLKTSS